jgi:hypothetical protein
MQGLPASIQTILPDFFPYFRPAGPTPGGSRGFPATWLARIMPGKDSKRYAV